MTFKLLPRHKVELCAFQGDGQRFADLFVQTWKRLPLWARRRILGFWRDALLFDKASSVARNSPIIELADDWSGRPERGFAMVDYLGHRMRFRPIDVDVMPADVVQDLIAHELAHVLQDVYGIKCISVDDEGIMTYIDANGDYFGCLREIEADADGAMDGWGFDHESIDRWSLAIGRTKVVEITADEAYRRLMLHGR
jgi:hypothetical protein